MIYIVQNILRVIVILTVLTGCQDSSRNKKRDPLPSWNDGPVKTAIIDFVKKVTDPSSPDFVPVHKRIAVFDNDGTLWAEKPVYTQLAFTFDLAREMVEEDPSLRIQEPYKSIVDEDYEHLKSLDHKDLLQLMIDTHASQGIEEIQKEVPAWLKLSKNPQLRVTYDKLVYKPMLELLCYLRGQCFKTWIVTGGGVEFVRSISEEYYGIPPEQVIGSSLAYEFVSNENGSSIQQQTKIGSINDKAVKPVNIHLHIGLRPIIAVGNSDGDLEMLTYSENKKGASLQLLLHHDDAEREFDYDEGTENALKAADKGQWKVISIKKDFKTVFNFQ